MDLFNKRISELQRMGYEVRKDDQFDIIEVRLKTKDNMGVTMTVSYRDLIDPEILILIVRKFNSYLSDF